MAYALLALPRSRLSWYEWLRAPVTLSALPWNAHSLLWNYGGMGRFALKVLINAAAIWLAGWILPGLSMSITASTGFQAEHPTASKIIAYIFLGLIFGVVNAIVKPVVKALSLPVTILTLGLFTVIINAAMLWFTAWLSSFTPVEWSIDSFFFTAIWAALIISVVSLLTSGLTKKRQKDR